MDVSTLEKAGWNAKIGLKEGIESVYQNLKTENWF
jgi:nucleoside-diphosphate-sugar epimerase